MQRRQLLITLPAFMAGLSFDMRSVAGAQDNSTLPINPLLSTNGYSAPRTPVYPSINPGQRTWLIFFYGQSNAANAMGGTGTTADFYTPGTQVNTLSILDGQVYQYQDPLVGVDGVNGNMIPRLADKLIAANKCDRVIIMAFAIGSTYAADWAAGGGCNQRIIAACNRAKGNNILSLVNKVLILRMQGENDALGSTTSLSYQASVQSEKATFVANGVNAPMYVALETYDGGSLPTNSSTIRAAQAAVVDNVNIFQGPDLDTLTAPTYRYGGGTHFNNTGADQVATLWNALL